ncbi:uncharacterized, partial [Tachysurus ichikawai]
LFYTNTTTGGAPKQQFPSCFVPVSDTLLLQPLAAASHMTFKSALEQFCLLPLQPLWLSSSSSYSSSSSSSSSFSFFPGAQSPHGI